MAEDVRRDYHAKLSKDDRRKFQRQTDFGLASSFEKMKGQNGGYVSDRLYLNAWVRGTREGLAKISFLWTDGENRSKSGVDEYDFEHYF